ncbi:MAG: MFS transporter, partial [Hyphomonadaceae bacterium]
SSFFDEHRGTALGIAMAGTGIGTAILPQILQFLIDEHGWRTAYLALAALMVGIALPSVLFLLRDPGDKSVAAEPTIAPVAGELPGIEAKQALTSRTFWLLAIVVFLVASVVYGVIVHAVPFLTDAGVPAAQAATVLIAAGMSTLVGRLLSGFLVDRIFAPFVGIFFFMLAILGLYLFGANVNPVIGMIFIGLASGAEIDLIGYLTSRYFGVKRFGLLYGLMFTVFAAGCAFGPFVMGFTYGADQSYDRAFIGFAIALIVACAILLTLGKYAYPIVKKEKSAAEAKPA